MNPSKGQLHSRFRGCLLGGALGDALGYPIEFSSASDILRRYPVQPGALPVDGSGETKISDDTQMTLFTVEGVIRAYQRISDRGICSPQSEWRTTRYSVLKKSGRRMPSPNPETSDGPS